MRATYDKKQIGIVRWYDLPRKDIMSLRTHIENIELTD